MPEVTRNESPSGCRVRTFSWGDPTIAVAAAQSLSGIDLLRRIMQSEIPAPPTFDLIDFRLTKVEPGEVSGEFQPAEFHYNPVGGVHGGIICTLLDTVMGAAVLTQLPPGCTWSAVEIKVNFVRPVSMASGMLLAEGKIVHPGSRLPTAEGRLVGRDGKLHAHGTTTCFVLREPA